MDRGGGAGRRSGPVRPLPLATRPRLPAALQSAGGRGRRRGGATAEGERGRLPAGGERSHGAGAFRAGGRTAARSGRSGPAQERPDRFRALRQDQFRRHRFRRAHQLPPRAGGRTGALGDVAQRSRTGARTRHLPEGLGFSGIAPAGQGQRAGAAAAGRPVVAAERAGGDAPAFERRGRFGAGIGLGPGYARGAAQPPAPQRKPGRPGAFRGRLGLSAEDRERPGREDQRHA